MPQVLLSQFYRWRNWGSGWFNVLPKVTWTWGRSQDVNSTTSFASVLTKKPNTNDAPIKPSNLTQVEVTKLSPEVLSVAGWGLPVRGLSSEKAAARRGLRTQAQPGWLACRRSVTSRLYLRQSLGPNLSQFLKNKILPGFPATTNYPLLSRLMGGGDGCGAWGNKKRKKMFTANKN